MKKMNDEYWMDRALFLAEKGRYHVSPNPMVGACIVKKGRLIAEGYHKRFGEPHAEINALRKAGTKAKGATMYVSLEPCSSWGKTPPCTDSIIKAGIKKVVVAVLDPNKKNRRKGVSALRREGVVVQTGVLGSPAKELNESFFKVMTKRLPFVTLKMAQSLDGKIATSEGKSKWISSSKSREYVHKLREENDAVLIGKNTLLLDDPFLSPRTKGKKTIPEKPWRIVLDPNLEAKSTSRIFKGKQLTLLVVAKNRLKSRSRSQKRGQRILLPVAYKNKRLDLREVLSKLALLGVSKLLVEGGGELAWSMLDQGLVDKVNWIVAPKFIGGRDAKTSVEGDGIKNLAKAIEFKTLEIEPIGEDLLFIGRPSKG